MRALTTLGLVFLIAGSVLAAEKVDKPAAIGTPVSDFTLQDFRGKPHSLSDYASSQIVVLAFLGTECPLARLYAPRLQELADEFADRGVTFLGIDSNRQDSLAKMAHYARVHGVQFPLLKDAGNHVADALGVERNPMVYVLDQDRVVRYRGRVDDQYGLGASTGYARPEVGRRDMAIAIDELLDGRDVSVPTTEAVGCLIGRQREVIEDSEVTYSNQIARIMQNHCVECHRDGQIAPFALTEYEDVVGWAEMIEEVVRQQRMPPWHADPQYGHFRNDRSMTDEEKELLYTWVRNGGPQGDPAHLPEPIEYSEEWQIPGPDEIYYMADEPFTVPAEGSIEYQYFVVDPGWTEDRWIKAAECMPGARSVVHHIFVFAVPPGIELPDFRETEESRGEFNPGSGGIELIAGTAPGTPPLIGPPGMATFVKAGTRLVFQMHYTPSGREVQDRSCVGFTFCDASEVKHNVVMNMAINFSFRIPAQADNHPVEANYTFRRDALLLNLTPHMHLRGKAFRYDLHYPDGTVETILNVPQYDFNWQTIYMLAEPKFVPAGTRMHCLAHFDNSADNLANPDPDHDVFWGDQTWEEMMIGWFAETTDVGPEDLGSLPTRTERFVAQAKEQPPRVGTLVERAAATAAQNQQEIDKFRLRLERIMPQIDRVCISVVEGREVRFVGVSQSPVLDYPAGRADRVYDAADAALAGYATAEDVTIEADLCGATSPDLAAMSRALGSSVHVPIVLDGKPASVNFWSKEKNAFPDVAVEILSELGKRVGASP